MGFGIHYFICFGDFVLIALICVLVGFLIYGLVFYCGVDACCAGVHFVYVLWFVLHAVSCVWIPLL